MLNLLLIGNSGIGKSTTLRDMAINHLVRPLPEELKPQIVTGKSTKEALHDDLMANPHTILLASELANTFSKEKYMEGMISYITDLLDLSPASVRTRSGGLKVIKEPSVTVMGGSTKEWLQEQLPSTATAGGFLPRFFIVKEDHKFQRVADPENALTREQKEKLAVHRDKTFGVFRAFVDFHRGKMEFADYEARDAYATWYHSYVPDNGILAPFAARASVQLLRLAILLALSRGSGEISAGDIKGASCLFNYSMSKLSEVIVPMSAQGKLMLKVLDVIGTDEVSDVTVKRAMRNYCGSREINQILDSLLQSKDIVFDQGLYRRVNS